MSHVLNVSMKEWVETYPLEQMNSDLIIVTLHGDQQKIFDNEIFPVRLDSFSLVLTFQGESSATIDYETYNQGKNMVMEIAGNRIFSGYSMSQDYRGYHIIISDLIMHAMRSQAYGPVLDVFEVNKSNSLSTLSQVDMAKLEDIVQRIRSYILTRSHHYREGLVYCELIVFLLELGNIIRKMGRQQETNRDLSRKNEIIADFKQLLSVHCRKEGEVGFYAGQLCITPEYLCRVMKSAGGKPANVWIREARLAEAKILLRRPDTTIQQVAEELYFSDQSAFGKFFKKHTGNSPLEYRKKSLVYSI